MQLTLNIADWPAAPPLLYHVRQRWASGAGGRAAGSAVGRCRIHNTLLLEELLVSAALLPEVTANPALELIGPIEWVLVSTPLK